MLKCGGVGIPRPQHGVRLRNARMYTRNNNKNK